MAGGSLSGISRETMADFIHQIQLDWNVLTAPQVGCGFRLFYGIAILVGIPYLLSPIDLFPGFLDDWFLFGMLVYGIPEILPKYILDPMKIEVGLLKKVKPRPSKRPTRKRRPE